MRERLREVAQLALINTATGLAGRSGTAHQRAPGSSRTEGGGPKVGEGKGAASAPESQSPSA